MAHLAQCAEFFRGSRVENYKPLFQLLSQLATSALLIPPSQYAPEEAAAVAEASLTLQEGTSVQTAAGTEASVDDERAAGDAAHEVQEFVRPSLSQQALRLLQAVVAGHEQVPHCCFSLHTVTSK